MTGTHVLPLLLRFLLGGSKLSAERQVFRGIAVDRRQAAVVSDDVDKANSPLADELDGNVGSASVHGADEAALLVRAIEGCHCQLGSSS